MATIITSECINCGACEPECPNTAIYQGGMEWEFKNATHPPLSDETFYIVPEKCTECVGFFAQEACAAVCPVDCCVPNPAIPETEAVLLARAKELHPQTAFPADFPSRFKAGNGHAAAPAAAARIATAVTPPVAAAPAPKPAPAAAPSKPAAAPAAPAPTAVKPAPAAEVKAAAPVAAPAVAAPPAPPAPPDSAVVPVKPLVAPADRAAVAAKSALESVSAGTGRVERRVEKPLVAPKVPPTGPQAPRVRRAFAAELRIPFDDATSLLDQGFYRGPSTAKWALAVAQPILGALPVAEKQALEKVINDSRFFSVGVSTVLNAVLNLVLYPLLLTGVGMPLAGPDPSGRMQIGLACLGVTLAVLEGILRMSEGFLGKPATEVIYRGAVYGFAVTPLLRASLCGLMPREEVGTVGQDGFRSMIFDEKLERERRYGEVYRLRERANGFLLELQLPRRVPPSAIKEQLGVPDEMPEYDYELGLQDAYFVVKARITDPTVRKVAAVSPAFPPDFTTQIKLPAPVAGFTHRCRDKVLEVALVRNI